MDFESGFEMVLEDQIKDRVYKKDLEEIKDL